MLTRPEFRELEELRRAAQRGAVALERIADAQELIALEATGSEIPATTERSGLLEAIVRSRRETRIS